MDDLPKIELSKPTQLVQSSTEKKAPNTNGGMKKKTFIILLFIVLFLVFLVFAVVLPAKKTYNSAQKTYQQARKAWEGAKKQNVVVAGQELIKTKEELVKTQNDLKNISFLQFIPIASWYYNDVDHLLKAGFHSLDAASILVEAVKPYADILGLKGQGSFVMGSAEQRIQTAILTMGKITPRIDDVDKNLLLAKKEIDQVDPNHYPPILGGKKVREQLQSIKALTDEGMDFVTEAKPLIKVLPSLLGESKDKKYLVIFQNDKELRPTGGFITAYAIFRIDKGVIHVDKSDDIYNLDNTIKNKQKAPEQIRKYLPLVTTFNLRDANLSPDFVESMKTFNSIYQSAGGKSDIDGIIALDTQVLISTIKILDDEVYAGGIQFTTKNDKRCECPGVIYQLESLISTPKSLDLRVTSLAAVQAQRKDMLGVLLYAIMEKALKSSPKLYWGPLVQQMIVDTNQKHVLFYLFDKNAQAGVEALNAAGRIVAFDGDYLHINDANMGGAKSNLFVKQEVSQKYTIGSDGSIEKTLTIQYKNPYPPSDCNLERGRLCLNGELRDWVRVYVPKGSVVTSSKGSEVKVTSKEELGKTVFDGFLTVRPLGFATYVLTYKLPFKITQNSPLPLLLQKQPGTYNNTYTTIVNGKTVEKFELLTDKKTVIKQ